MDHIVIVKLNLTRDKMRNKEGFILSFYLELKDKR